MYLKPIERLRFKNNGVLSTKFPFSGPAETTGCSTHCEAGSSRFGLKLLIQHGSHVFYQESVGHSDYPRAASHEGHPGTLQRSRSYPHEV